MMTRAGYDPIKRRNEYLNSKKICPICGINKFCSTTKRVKSCWSCLLERRKVGLVKSGKPFIIGYKSAFTGEKNPGWKGGFPKCIDCGDNLKSYISKRCQSCWYKFNQGENHSLWKGSKRLKNNERNDGLYQFWVSQIKKRDKQCKFKNENCQGYLVVHHILSWSEYPEERYNINNGITLCQYHHPRKKEDERRLIPVFKKLVGSN